MEKRLKNDEAGPAPQQTGLYETTLDPSQFASADAAAQAVVARDQRIGDAIARASSAGYSVHITSGPTGRALFVASRWGWARDFETVEGLEQWLNRVDPKGAPA